jgi:hypothetical protein
LNELQKELGKYEIKWKGGIENGKNQRDIQ